MKSDIRITTTQEGFNMLNNNINEYLKNNNYGLGNNLLLMLDVDIKRINNQRYFGWNNITWLTHLHHKEVDALMIGLKELKDKDIPFRFLRIGEEVSDIEEFINDDYLKLDYIKTSRRFLD